MPNVSKAACASQQATPVAIVPRVQVAPPFIENARKILLEVVFERATRLLVLVGLTTTKLSAWLPVVALALTTAIVQANGTKPLTGVGIRFCGLIHLRVPSGTSMPSGAAASTCACRANGAGVRKTKTAARAVRRRRKFIIIVLRSKRRMTQSDASLKRFATKCLGVS
ncbi:MAG: hypothetical protein DMF06_13330 [Verrucomicrobia bacterium]|nr:MAG: hypothetical protein DMF06_13330 [Verrucomicrobiota bacterium]